MKSLFVMDPLDRIQVRGDSTYITMRECTERGHPVWYCTPDKLFAQDGRAYAAATEVRVTEDAPWFHVGQKATLELGAFDVVWMRKDPPFDMSYIFTTYLLDMAPARTLVVNHPVGLKLFNEKLWAMRFPELHPSTLLSSDILRLRAFVESIDGRVVIKPWHGNGGRGVVVTDAADRNLNALLELLTEEGKEYAIAQRYIPGIVKGDKRILLFDGEPVGAFLRVPSERDHRGNMHVGARVESTELDDRDRKICDTLGPELRRWGQVFVGIDVIDGYLTEINVTSPTGIQDANRLYGVALQRDLVDRVERRLAEHRAKEDG